MNYYPGDKISLIDGNHFLILEIKANSIVFKKGDGNIGNHTTMTTHNFLKKYRKQLSVPDLGKRNFREKTLKELIELDEKKTQQKVKNQLISENKYCSYSEAKKWVLLNLFPLGVKSSHAWNLYLAGEFESAPSLPAIIPRNPSEGFRYCGWTNWKDFFRHVKESPNEKKKRDADSKQGNYLRYGKSDGTGRYKDYELVHY